MKNMWVCVAHEESLINLDTILTSCQLSDRMFIESIQVALAPVIHLLYVIMTSPRELSWGCILAFLM